MSVALQRRKARIPAGKQLEALRKYKWINVIEKVGPNKYYLETTRLILPARHGVKHHIGRLAVTIDLKEEVLYHDYNCFQVRNLDYRLGMPTQDVYVGFTTIGSAILESESYRSGHFVCWGSTAWTDGINKLRVERDLVGLLEAFYHFLNQPSMYNKYFPIAGQDQNT